MKDYRNITRKGFMNFFRNDDKLSELSTDDRIEIFSTILTGSSDFSKKLLDNILSDYNVDFLKVIENNNENK